MGNCLTDALWSECYEGIDIDEYLKMVESNEHLCHHGVVEALREWISSPYYELDRKVYKEIVEAVSPLIKKGIMEDNGLDVEPWSFGWDVVDVELNLSCEINGKDTYCFNGSYNTISDIIRKFVNSLEQESIKEAN